MKLGLIGGKLGHSYSPEIHRRLFKMLDLHHEMEYGLLEMNRHDIPNELEQLAKEYTGMNVTIPYKLDVMPHLTDISEEARRIGAVNTIHIKEDGCYGLYRLRPFSGPCGHICPRQGLHHSRYGRCGSGGGAVFGRPEGCRRDDRFP